MCKEQKRMVADLKFSESLPFIIMYHWQKVQFYAACTSCVWKKKLSPCWHLIQKHVHILAVTTTFHRGVKSSNPLNLIFKQCFSSLFKLLFSKANRVQLKQKQVTFMLHSFSNYEVSKLLRMIKMLRNTSYDICMKWIFVWKSWFLGC